jgi:uncharacterized membrane protein YGL010W
MRSLDQWLSAYAETHQNETNKKIHTICVPAILFSLVGMLWCIPKGFLFPETSLINWSHVAMIPALIFYAKLSAKAFNLMLSTFIIVSLVQSVLAYNNAPLLAINLTIFIAAWAGQFYGHYIEGKKPSFFEDLQFLLIGPLWVYYH